MGPKPWGRSLRKGSGIPEGGSREMIPWDNTTIIMSSSCHAVPFLPCCALPAMLCPSCHAVSFLPCCALPAMLCPSCHAVPFLPCCAHSVSPSDEPMLLRSRRSTASGSACVGSAIGTLRRGFRPLAGPGPAARP
jgi:hypothetical protein